MEINDLHDGIELFDDQAMKTIQDFADRSKWRYLLLFFFFCMAGIFCLIDIGCIKWILQGDNVISNCVGMAIMTVLVILFVYLGLKQHRKCVEEIKSVRQLKFKYRVGYVTNKYIEIDNSGSRVGARRSKIPIICFDDVKAHAESMELYENTNIDDELYVVYLPTNIYAIKKYV